MLTGRKGAPGKSPRGIVYGGRLSSKMGDEHARGKREETGDGMHGQGVIIHHGAVAAPKLGTRLDTGHGRG
jgi:hypothetical protein